MGTGDGGASAPGTEPPGRSRHPYAHIFFSNRSAPSETSSRQHPLDPVLGGTALFDYNPDSDAFAITEEPAHGSDAPTMNPLASITLP